MSYFTDDILRMGHIHYCHGKKLSSKLFSKPGNPQLFSLTQGVKIHKPSKTEFNVIHFLDFQGLENGRSFCRSFPRLSQTAGTPLKMARLTFGQLGPQDGELLWVPEELHNVLQLLLRFIHLPQNAIHINLYITPLLHHQQDRYAARHGGQEWKRTHTVGINYKALLSNVSAVAYHSSKLTVS